MCGRIAYYSDKSELESFLETKIKIDFLPSYNICPTDNILILRDLGAPEVAKWGLVPPWAKDQKSILINARADTITEKPSFREAFNKRRCLVLANGFYEWKREQGTKPQPCYISSPDSPILAFAGILNDGTASQPSNVSIITTEANQAMRTIHDRMPVVLSKNSWSSWFDYSKEAKDISTMLGSFSDAILNIKLVSGAVSDVRNKSVECIGELQI